MMSAISSNMDLILKVLNIIALLYAFYKFTKKPGEDISARLAKIEHRLDEYERSLNTNWDMTRNHQTMIDDIQLCILYLLDFEVTFCAHFPTEGGEKVDTSDLDEARNIIRTRLKK